MTAKSEQKDRTRATILDSAAKLVRERGIAGARVADVMLGAGLTVGGFYAHFRSKEALIDETLRRTALEMRDRLFAGLDEKPEADRANVIVKRYVSAAHRDNPTTGCPLPTVSGEVALDARAHREVLSAQVRTMAEGLAAHLPHEHEGITTRDLSLGVVALMIGALTLARATASPDGTDDALSDEILRAARAFARHGLRGGVR